MPWLSIIINVLDFNELFYCSSVWSNTTQANLDKLQAVQNFTYRILCEKPKEICGWLATNQATTLFPFCCCGMMGCQKFCHLDKNYQELSTFEHTTLPHC